MATPWRTLQRAASTLVSTFRPVTQTQLSHSQRFSLEPQSLQIQLLRARKIEHFHAHSLRKLLQPHVAAVREVQCVAIRVRRRRELRERDLFLRLHSE